jgi:hypothetical protein
MNQVKFDKTGKETQDSLYVAEIIMNGANSNYFIKTFGSALFDPYGPYSKREKVLDTKFKKVTKNTFDNYIKYLETKNNKFFTVAQRGFIDDRA